MEEKLVPQQITPAPMTPEEIRVRLPFLHRYHLAFGQEATFELEIRSQSLASGILTIRGMTRSGIFVFKHSLVAGGTPKTEKFSIPDIPITVTVTDKIGTRVQGETYAVLSLLVSGELIQELTAGFVMRDKGITYPGAATPTQRPNGGFLTARDSATPAAGQNPSLVLPGNFVARVIFLVFDLTTDATVADRLVTLVFDTPAVGQIVAFSGVAQAASLYRYYNCAPYPVMPALTQYNNTLISFPTDLILPADTTIKTTTLNLKAGDQYSAINAYLELFPAGEI